MQELYPVRGMYDGRHHAVLGMRSGKRAGFGCISSRWNTTGSGCVLVRSPVTLMFVVKPLQRFVMRVSQAYRLYKKNATAVLYLPNRCGGRAYAPKGGVSESRSGLGGCT